MRLFSTRTIRVPMLGLLLAGLIAASGPFLSVHPARAATTFVVNGTGDAGDIDPTDGVCDAQPPTGSQCTLRAAIQQANALAGADTINFAIPGDGVQTIRPNSPLPPITEAVTINGYTQPGASPNTLPRGTNAVLRVELDGTNVCCDSFGLRLRSPNILVRGLVINRWETGVYFYGNNSTGSRVAGCFIGTNADGTAPLPNGSGVLAIKQNATIGGDTVAARNLISGNEFTGIQLLNANGVRVVNNLIGTDKSGDAPLGLSDIGVFIAGASNTIGGDGPNEPNTIAFADDFGVFVLVGVGNRIQRNSIFAIDFQGIALDDDGPTPNDPQDPDLGPNRLQNFPVILTANPTIVDGSLNSRPNRDFAIRLYSNPPGGDEGRTFRGGPTVVTTNDNGDAFFDFTPSPPIPVGHTVTATATDVMSGDTSEFSLPVTVVSGPV